MKTLNNLIKACKFNYVNSDITEKHFPLKKIRGKVKIFNFDYFISSEDAIKEMEKEGYQPANAYELLEYAKNDWNENDWIVALGSTWQASPGNLAVLVLHSSSGGRELRFDCFACRWDRPCVFAGVRKSLETQPLGSALELEPFETRLLSLEEKFRKLKEIL